MSTGAIPHSVIVIEDEVQIRRFVRVALEAENCKVTEAGSGERGIIESGTRKPDLIVLDLGLPDRDGIDVIREIRTWSGVPILILSARSMESDKVRALDAGADDYLTKPFGIPELQARVRALLRRAVHSSGTENPQFIRFGNSSRPLPSNRPKRTHARCANASKPSTGSGRLNR
jgi:two-component system KDP operon response regulator KdpE